PADGRLAVVATTEPGSSADSDTPLSAEDIRDFAKLLRSLPVDQVIGDVMFTLLNAAQAKLGRRDARLLIDVSSVAHQHARPYLPDALTKQIDQVLGQLRLSQVSAEGHAAKSGEQEENDLKMVPAPPAEAPSPG
ncbi:MAG: hypothetical protein J2P28_25760, partial [Actinobacteria bacterium]|nr:hypothetical protein [Actinomycetota bacterium]